MVLDFTLRDVLTYSKTSVKGPLKKIYKMLQTLDGSVTNLDGRITTIEGKEVEDLIETVDVSISSGNSTGASAADENLISAIVLGVVPAGNQDQFIDDVDVEEDGKVRITLAANATDQNSFTVTVRKATS